MWYLFFGAIFGTYYFDKNYDVFENLTVEHRRGAYLFIIAFAAHVLLFPFFIGLDVVEKVKSLGNDKFNNPIKEIFSKTRKNNESED